MSPEMVLDLCRQAVKVTLLVSLPILSIGLVVGILVSLFQAATQIQEMTLTFIPKIVSIFVGLLLLLPWIMSQLMTFTTGIMGNLPQYIR